MRENGDRPRFKPATSNNGYPAYAISFNPHHRYPKFALPRSTVKKGEK